MERIQNGLGVIGGSSVFSTFKLDYHQRLSHSGPMWYRSGYGSAWTDPNPVPIAYDTTTDPRFPSFHTLDGTNPANPANYTLNNIGLGPSYAHDGETAGMLDATIPTGSCASVRASGNSVFPCATAVGKDQYGVIPGIHAQRHHLIGAVYLRFESDLLQQPLRYWTGDQPSLDTKPGARQLGHDHRRDAAADASTNSDDRENVYAGYGQYTARFGKVGVLAGVRAESTHATYGGNLYNSDTDVNTPTTERNSYTNYFPTLQGRYDFLDTVVGRLTYSTGIARPGFEQITPGASISVTNAAVTVGNPALKPTLGRKNFDATLEYYPGNGQIAAVGLFYKQFKDYILLSQQTVSGYDFPGLTNTITRIQTYTNGPAHADGIEGQRQAAAEIPAGAARRVGLQRQLHPGRLAGRDSPGHLRFASLHLEGHVECGAILRARAIRGAGGRRLRRPKSIRLRRYHEAMPPMCIHAIVSPSMWAAAKPASPAR